MLQRATCCFKADRTSLELFFIVFSLTFELKVFEKVQISESGKVSGADLFEFLVNCKLQIVLKFELS